MTCDACFLFRGDIRYDTRLRNFVYTLARAGKSCLVIQGASTEETFRCEGAVVNSFRVTQSGPLGFRQYWRNAGLQCKQIEAPVWWAAELYSLPVAVKRARACGGLAVYDAREIFAHLGALNRKPLVQAYWRWLERKHIHRAHAVITTGELDADFLASRYGIARPHVVRNVPRFQVTPRTHALHDILAIPHETPVCLYVGGLQQGRGIPTMLAMAEQIPQAAFVFIGDGPLANDIDNARQRTANVYRLSAVQNDQIISLAASATIGFALIEPISLSYKYALPNKLFEYIMAGTPVIATDLPQMKAIIDRYGVGVVVSSGSVDDAILATRRLLADKSWHQTCAANCRAAARELCWEQEVERVLPALRQLGIL